MLEPIVVTKYTKLSDPVSVYITKDCDPYSMYDSLRNCPEIYVSYENTFTHHAKRLPMVRVYYRQLNMRVILRRLSKLTEEEKVECRQTGYIVIHDRKSSIEDRISLVTEANAEEHVRQTIQALIDNKDFLPGQTVTLVSHMRSEREASKLIDKYAQWLDRTKLGIEDCRIVYYV